jgi:hypothetical protein
MFSFLGGDSQQVKKGEKYLQESCKDSILEGVRKSGPNGSKSNQQVRSSPLAVQVDLDHWQVVLYSIIS